MAEKEYLGNIWKLYIIKIARSAMFMMPIITLFFTERGLNMTQIMILQSAFAIAIIILEIPSGYIADIFDRRISIIVSVVFASLGNFAYSIAYGFSGMLVAEILMAIAGALMSGADSALLYDSLKTVDKQDNHTKYASFMFSLSRLSETLASIIGGFVAALWSMSTTFILSAVFILATLPLAFLIKEPPRQKIEKSAKHAQEIFKIIKFAIHSNKKIKFLIIYASVISASTLVIVWSIQPFAKSLGVDIKYFGILWAVYNLSGAIFAYFAHKIENWLGATKSLIALLVFPIIGYLSLALFKSPWALLFSLFFSATFAFYTPIFQDYINKEVSSKIRATVLSVYSLLSRLGFVVLSPFIGYIADIYDLRTAFLASAVIFGLSGSIALFMLLKTNRQSR